MIAAVGPATLKAAAKECDGDQNRMPSAPANHMRGAAAYRGGPAKGGYKRLADDDGKRAMTRFDATA